MANQDRPFELNVFKGGNYPSWKQRLENNIECEDLEAALLPKNDEMDEAVYSKMVKKLKKEIFTRLDDQRITELSGCKTPADMIEKLDANYLHTGNTTVASLLRQLKYTRFDDKDLESHISNFDHIAAQLVLVKHLVSNIQLAFDLMESMPDDGWKLQKANFRANSANHDITYDEVKKSLRNEDAARKFGGNGGNHFKEHSSSMCAYSHSYGKGGNGGG